MAKYRKLQQEMEGAVERADMAENTLGQLRARNRSASVAPESTTTFGLTVINFAFHSVQILCQQAFKLTRNRKLSPFFPIRFSHYSALD